ncbi:MAG TPA: hypothetical protein VH415_08580 [Nitrososphaeraceae archaeon]|jgi:hypothetical protein
MKLSGWRKGLGMISGIVTFVMILVAGSAVAPSYGKTIHFETPFESSFVTACSGEEVAVIGVVKFVFKEKIDNDGNVLQDATASYSAHAVGMTSGTKYIVHEKEAQTALVETGGDTTFSTVLKGKFNGQGSEPNTKLRIQQVTVIHENGDVETLVDDVSVTCH